MTTSAEKIYQRARELNIIIWVEDDKIKCRGYDTIPPKMVEVIRIHKEELILYLQALEEKELAQLKEGQTLCIACLDQGTETPAHFIGPEDLMYCKEHYDALPTGVYQADMERIAEAYRQALPGWKITVEPRYPQNQRQEEPTPSDYWAKARKRLTQQGYYEQVAKSEERFRQRIVQPRSYPTCCPAYAWVEVDGEKRLELVGRWHKTEDRLLTEDELKAEE